MTQVWVGELYLLYRVCHYMHLVAMENWPVNQRVFAVTTYIETKSVITVQRRFRAQFNIPRRGRIPSRNIILRWFNKWNNHGTVCDRFVGSLRTVRTPENIERVRQAVTGSPTRSANKHADVLHLSDRTLRRILHNDLNFHPYKIQIVHQLSPQDAPNRLTFCREFVRLLNEGANVINNLIMSDEAHFHLSGYVNKQNFRYWCAEQPMQLHEQPLHAEKVTVWCGVATFGIIGPYFFQENNRTVTVNSERYLQMLETFLTAELRRLGVNNNEIWFQQDGATSHTARRVMAFLRNMFPGRLLSRNGDIAWPARSPDLTAPDSFLWGYLKSKVYLNKPRTLDDLRNNITQEIREIDGTLRRAVMNHVRENIEKCIEYNGGHLKSVIFKK